MSLREMEGRKPIAWSALGLNAETVCALVVGKTSCRWALPPAPTDLAGLPPRRKASGMIDETFAGGNPYET